MEAHSGLIIYYMTLMYFIYIGNDDAIMFEIEGSMYCDSFKEFLGFFSLDSWWIRGTCLFFWGEIPTTATWPHLWPPWKCVGTPFPSKEARGDAPLWSLAGISKGIEKPTFECGFLQNGTQLSARPSIA